MAIDDFFRRLPHGKLTPLEDKLRSLLFQVAETSEQLLPKDGSVSLQAWVEQRIPNQFILDLNSEGMIIIKANAKKQAAELTEPTPFLFPDDTWFATLPTDGFTRQEEQLREQVLAMLRGGPLSVAGLKQNTELRAAASFIPRAVSVESWIERRIGLEARLYEDKNKGKLMVKMSGPSKEERQEIKESFLQSLPEHDFTTAENRLRQLLLDFIASHKGTATLSHVGGDKAIKEARHALLPEAVSMKQWIERRLGADIELKPHMGGQIALHPLVSSGQARAGYRAQAEPHEVPAEDKMRQRGEFLSSLPADMLNDEELELRQALFSFLDGWKGSTPPSLSNCGQDDRIKRAKNGLLPKGISLQAWIEMRIGGEVQLVQDPDGANRECWIGFPGDLDMAKCASMFRKMSNRSTRGPLGERGPAKRARRG